MALNEFIDAPATWEAYLLRGDRSGLSEAELAECDQWLAGFEAGWTVVGREPGEHLGYFCPLPLRDRRRVPLITYAVGKKETSHPDGKQGTAQTLLERFMEAYPNLTRQEAMDLLERNPLSEGMWDDTR